MSTQLTATGIVFPDATVQTTSGGMPSGILLPYTGSTEPTGWLFCYGQAVSRSTYSSLYNVIGTTYGSGDGSTTFNLPDLRGRAPFGKDDMGGSAQNRITSGVSGISGTTLGAAGGDQRLTSHSHTVTDPNHSHSISPQYVGPNSGVSPVGSLYPVTEGFIAVDYFSSTSGASTGITGTNSQGSGAAQNMPPAIILNYIIKT